MTLKLNIRTEMASLGSKKMALTQLASSVNWGKCINPYTFFNNILNGHQHQLAKCLSWNKKTNTRCYVTESSRLYDSFVNRTHRCLLNSRNVGINTVRHSYSRRPCPLAQQGAHRKHVLYGSCVSPKLQNITTQNIQIFRDFHGSPALNAAPAPILMLILKPVQKLLAVIVGRSIRKWWQALPPNKKELFKEAAKKNKWKITFGFCGVGVVFILFYFTHLEETPITGRTRLVVFKKDQFAEFSQIECNMWMQEYKNKMLPETDSLFKVVKQVVNHLAESNKDVPEFSEFTWTVHVIDEPDINALVFPNGHMFVFTGMLAAVSDINQLSFILGHEIAHAVLGHAAEKASVMHFLDFFSIILLTMIWAICPRDSLALIGHWLQSRIQALLFDMPYSRTLEAEADKVGLQFAAKACMDVRASSVFWQQMELADSIKNLPKVPEWLSTHPSHENRAEHLDRLIPEALKIRERCNCPSLPSQDPRLTFKLIMQHLTEVSKSKVPNATQHGSVFPEVHHPFSQKEKIPVDIVGK